MKKLLTILTLSFLLPYGSMCLTGCVSGDDGSRGVRVLEDMDEGQFSDLLVYTETGVRLATSQIIKRTEVDPSVLQSVADALRDTASEEAVVVVGGLLSDAANRALGDNVNIPKEAILAVLNFVEGRVDLGGLVLPDGTVALTVRTKALINAVAQGIEQGIANEALGFRDNEINNTRYNDIVATAQRACEDYRNASR